jgi:hypothetical protein
MKYKMLEKVNTYKYKYKEAKVLIGGLKDLGKYVSSFMMSRVANILHHRPHFSIYHNYTIMLITFLLLE